ncbi:phage shock protein A [Desulfobaculum xiamenense]|uniref:Phage shock protein A n=1 Tax=Desulfobaculum xiamenense TaxID=995050 RepID=A0A846QNJ2_9BACT|nr:phage shock protein PspA [Desulfobaculum xiamenense]NJB67843.1 phage shock protein A [Desulfobaculum xiamenense]
MGVFTRFKDIVSSNLNSLLDRAEDPEKLIRLMVQEMEETLVELKSSCAKFMADRKNLEREFEGVRESATKWTMRAELAVDKGRDDLAREALAEKAVWQRRLESLDEEAAHLDALVEQARDDIARLEDKLASAREKQRLLVQRHARATERKRAGHTLTRAESGDAMLRFDKFESRIERLEAEAELAAPARRTNLEDEFVLLEKEDGIEAELARMKQAAQNKDSGER